MGPSDLLMAATSQSPATEKVTIWSRFVARGGESANQAVCTGAMGGPCFTHFQHVQDSSPSASGSSSQIVISGLNQNIVMMVFGSEKRIPDARQSRKRLRDVRRMAGALQLPKRLHVDRPCCRDGGEPTRSSGHADGARRAGELATATAHLLAGPRSCRLCGLPV